MVEVSNKHKSITVGVSSNNGNTIVTAKSDTSQYWANQSHTFADQAKESAQEAKNYAELANSYIEGFENVVTNNTNNIIATSNDCINQLNTTKEEVTEEINEAVASGKDEINSAKTTIINDIEFVADGEKKEIEDLIDNGKEELKEAIGDVKVLTTLEIGDIGIAPLGIDETKGKRRYLNGQLIIQEQYVQFTNKVKSAVALYPSLACTESEWQTTATMTVGGQVGKFVVDDDAGTIRLPKIIMPIQGLTDLSKLGEIVEAGLPNITGNTGNIVGYSNQNGSGAMSGRTNTASANLSSGSLVTSANIPFDASLSNTTYGKSKTVQQEQIQYPYFIQVATGAETEDNIINEIELNNPFSLLDYKFSEYELNNISWLRSNGQYNSKAIYPAVYDLLLKIYNKTETKAGVSVKLSTEDYTDYDFVLNSAEETFMLPLLDGSESIIDWDNVISDLDTGEDYVVPCNGALIYSIMSARTNNGNTGFSITINGVLYLFHQGYQGTDYLHPTNGFLQLKKGDVINVAESEGQKVDFVKYKGNGSLYYYVGETVQNANLINAGRIEEKLVDKADTNASNFTADGKSLIANFGLPSEEYIDITVGANDATYIMSADGYLAIYSASPNTSEGGNVGLKNLTLGNFAVDSLNIWGRRKSCFLPVRKNDKVMVTHGGHVISLRLYLLQGNKGE